jgi:hypothetical protein
MYQPASHSPARVERSFRPAPTAAADRYADSPRQVAQRTLFGHLFGPGYALPAPLLPAAPVAQREGHMPRKGHKIRYPATGPKEGDLYTVQEAQEGGALKVTNDKDSKTSWLDWKTDAIWHVLAGDTKDTDSRRSATEWGNLTPQKKTQAYDAAKAEALRLLLLAAEPAMVNKTTASKLKKDVVLASFVKQRVGEWQMAWTEINDRTWQFTIDMDKPEADSWQEPHVGWEVKQINAGANNGGKAYEPYKKQQGHVWMNEVPEYRQ